MKKLSFILFLSFVSIITSEGNFYEELSKLAKISPKEVSGMVSHIENRKKAIENVETGAWSVYYDFLPELINKHNLEVGVEIGVAFGGHAEAILKKSNIATLYGVDPYLEYAGFLHNFFGLNVAQNKKQKYWDILFYLTKKRLSGFGKRSILIRDFSNNAANKFENNSLDFIFIDGNHTYNSVKEDLESWCDKIKTGGFFVGDDYHLPEVKKAVDEFSQKLNLQVHIDQTINRIWYICKSAI